MMSEIGDGEHDGEVSPDPEVYVALVAYMYGIGVLV